MPVIPFPHTLAFNPKATEAISLALRSVCRALGLAERDDLFTAMVAKHIIELAQTGEHTPTALYMLTLKEFKANPQ